MTVLAGLAVNPGSLGTPYVLIGADTKSRVAYTKFDREHNIIAEIPTDDSENCKKVFKPTANIIFGLSGQFRDDLDSDIVTFTQSLHPDQLKLMIFTELIKNQLLSESQPIYNLSIIIGGYINSIPSLSFFDVNKGSLENEIQYRIPEPNSILPIFGGVEIDSTLAKELQQNIGTVPLTNIPYIRKFLELYLQKVAAKHPESCNQSILIERLKTNS